MNLFEVELEIGFWRISTNPLLSQKTSIRTASSLVRQPSEFSFTSIFGFDASQGKEVEKDYAELCAVLNVRSYEHVSKIKETMGLSLDELVSISYLKSWDIKPMSSKMGYRLVLVPGRAMRDVLVMTQRKQLAFAAAHNDVSLSDSRKPARVALMENGISEAKAAEFV